MNPATALLVLDAIALAERALANYFGQPAGWKPTPEDWNQFYAEVDEASPEIEKVRAMERLGLKERVPYSGPE